MRIPFWQRCCAGHRGSFHWYRLSCNTWHAMGEVCAICGINRDKQNTWMRLTFLPQNLGFTNLNLRILTSFRTRNGSLNEKKQKTSTVGRSSGHLVVTVTTDYTGLQLPEFPACHCESKGCCASGCESFYKELLSQI